ncbi:hypothetical protein AB0L40_26310 [Patulibacter sp. NPDC049589]|uniref:hypothetical protein n=1 Tax=Patulibacter sp. NPDC049589 TaxID=3154731 RepID=UPI003431F548
MLEPLTVRREIVEAALSQLATAGLEQVFKWVTPERLAADGPWAPSTIRYQFGHGDGHDEKGRLAFRRVDLALAMLEVALDDDSGADAETQAEGITAEPLTPSTVADRLAAVVADADRLVPSLTARDLPHGARMSHLALAFADSDVEAARLLRADRRRRTASATAAYKALMGALDRQMRPGRRIEELADAIDALLDGHASRVRCDPQTSADWLGETVLAVFASFTVRRGEDPRDAAADLLR